MNTAVWVTVAYALGSGLLVSLVSLSGMFVLWIQAERLATLVQYLVALAVGVLLGDAFIHLIPDAIQRLGSVSEVCLTTLAGLFLFFVVERSFPSCLRMSPSVNPRPRRSLLTGGLFLSCRESSYRLTWPILPAFTNLK